MRCAWMSERGKVSADTVVGRFFRDRDVVNVALAHTGVGDANELGARAHFLNGLAAGVTHRRAQAAGELVQDGDDRALVGHAAFHRSEERRAGKECRSRWSPY